MVINHFAEFYQLKKFPILSYTLLHKKYRAWHPEFYRQCHHQQNRPKDEQAEKGGEDIESSL